MGSSNTGKVLVIIGFVLFLIPFIGVPIIMFSGPGGFSFAPLLFIFAAIGFILIIAGNIISGKIGFMRYPYGGSAIPPVQYPTQPRGAEDGRPPQTAACPKCGAPPRNVSSYGWITCEYCHSKYKV